MTTTDSRSEREEWIRDACAHAVRIRRALHRQPEVGLRLPRTQRRVLDELAALGIPAATGDGADSVVGLIRGDRPGPTVLLRADMDALAISETTGVDFASEVDGRMHACGHDLHTAGLLGAARVLKRMTPVIRGNVVLMFQPGEEGWFGARVMIDEGVLGAPAQDVAAPGRAFALHVNPWYPVGTVSTRAGAILAAADSFRIVLTGVSGHGSAPHSALDPIPAAAELVLAIQTQVARRNPPFDPAVVSVTGVQAGTPSARSAIPAAAELTGTFRTHSAVRRAETADGLRRLAEGVAMAHGLRADVEIEHGYPATHNDAEAVAEVVPALSRWVPGGLRMLADPLMGSEDFSYVLENVPGLLAFVGTSSEADLADGWPADNHSADVRYDERSLDTFIRAHLGFVDAALGGLDADGE